MTLDISKQLETSDPKNISSRFVSTDDFLNMTSSIPKQSNVITFADTSDVIKEVKPETDTLSQINKKELKNIDSEILDSLSSTLGYPILTKDDLKKGINKTTDNLKKRVASLLGTLYLDDYISKNINNILNKKTSFNKYNTQEYYNSLKTEFKNSFGSSLYTPDINLENNLVSKYYNKLSISKNKYLDVSLSKLNKSVNNFFKDNINILSKASEDLKSFISNPLSSDYLSNFVPKEDLDYIKNAIDKVLKYATSTCDNLTDLMKTIMYGVNDILDTLNKLLNITIEYNINPLFSDLLNCFDRLKDTINDIKSTDNIVKKIETLGKGPSLTIVNGSKNKIHWNAKKTLYTTYLNTDKKYNSDEEYINAYDSIKTSNNINDKEYINCNDNDNIIIYDIPKIKKHEMLADMVLKNNNEEKETNKLLKKVPLAIIT